MEVAAFEAARELAAARLAHLVARAFEVVGEYEILCAVSDHLVRRIAENGARARADAEKIAAPVHHQDEIERGVEDALIDRADRFALAFVPQDRAAAFVALIAEQDGVAARMRIAAHVHPGAEHLGEAGECHRLAAQLRRRIHGAERVVRIDVENFVDRLADQRADIAAPHALDRLVDIDQPPRVIERDDAVGDAGQHGVARGGRGERFVTRLHERTTVSRALRALIVHRSLQFGATIYAPLAPMSFRIAFCGGSVKRFPNAIDVHTGLHAGELRIPVSAMPAAPAGR